MSEITIDDAEKMLEIAKEDLLNPLYEQVVREYEEAKVRIDHATNKLAQAVKLTDYDKLEARRNPKRNIDAELDYLNAMVQMMQVQKMSSGQ